MNTRETDKRIVGVFYQIIFQTKNNKKEGIDECPISMCLCCIPINGQFNKTHFYLQIPEN